MKIAIKACYYLVLLFLFSCETKTVKEEPIGICGNAPDPSFNSPIPVEENCYSCHAFEVKVLGASFKEISRRNLPKERVIQLLKDPQKFNDTISSKIFHPSFENLPDSSLREIANWLDTLKYN